MDQKCTKCHKVFPWTNEYFNWERKKQGLLRKICKDCFHILAKGYREKYKVVKEDPELFQIIIPTQEEKEKRLYKAYAKLFRQAFGQSLSKEEFIKLNITV